MVLTKDELQRRIGQQLGVSEWFQVDQERVDRFADVTEDHQFIHVDPERAKATPFGGTIAHGLLTLSMIVHLSRSFVPQLENTRLLVNYGFDRVRFSAPVKVGSRIRAVGRLADVAERGPKQVLIRMDVTVEVEHLEKPALVAEWWSLHVVA